MKNHRYLIPRGKTLFALGILSLSLIGVSNAVGQPPRRTAGTIRKAWVSPGTLRPQGFKLEKTPPTIHVNLYTEYVSNCPLQASFFSEDGQAIAAPAYSSNKNANGQLAVTKILSPPGEYSDLPNIVLPVPVRELTSKENYGKNVKFSVTLRCGDKELARSNSVALPFAVIKSP